MNKNIFFIAIVLFFIPLYAHAEILRTLKLGDRGTDVKELQVFLNSDPGTRIATSGVGSPGYESTYFGGLTAAAVKRLQIKYAYETLTPAGLSSPTGVVGLYTRNLIYKIIHTTTPTPATPVTPPSIPTGIPPKITSVSPMIVTTSPQTLTITGTGFTTTDNTLIIASDGDQGVGSYGSTNGTTLSFPFVFVTGEKMKSQLVPYKGSARYPQILAEFVKNLGGETVTRQNGTTYIRAILKIKNANGESNAVTVQVDIKELLK